MSNLNNKQLNILDIELSKFRNIERAIWIRKAELMSKNGEEVIGSRGSGISKPTENTICRWAEDITLRNLELYKETVEQFLAMLDEEQRGIFISRWMTIPQKDWEQIADDTFVSTATIYRKRKNMLMCYAEIKGDL